MGVKEGIFMLSYIFVPLVDLWFLFSFHNFRLSNRRVDKVHKEVIPKQISLYVNYMYSIYASKYVSLSVCIHINLSINLYINLSIHNRICWVFLGGGVIWSLRDCA